jgi:tetratricopeptide (TPR) repeat protein
LVSEAGCDRALSLLSPSNAVDGMLQVLLYSKQGQLQKAAEVFLALADEISGREEAYLENLAGKARASLSPYAAAKMAEAENLEKNGQLAEALKIYGQVMKLAEDEQAKKLRAHLSEIFKAHPEFREMPEEARKYYVRSEVMNREGKFLESLAECRKALKIAPLSPELYKALALNYAKLEKFKLAIANMNIYLELFPDALDSRAAKDLIYQWEYLLEEKGNLDQ